MASGLSAHFFASSTSIGSVLSQYTHTNSVRPVRLGAGTILFPHCKQRVIWSICDLLRSCSPTVLRDDGSNASLHDAGSHEGVDLAHTAVGLLLTTHEPFEAWLACRPVRSSIDLLRDATITSAIAGVVDYGMAPKRMTPGWELILTRRSMGELLRAWQ
jgi:hypothetical protein